MKFSKELMDGAKACRNEEELLSFAKENGVTLTEEDVSILMEEFREGELADDELDSVAGGSGCGTDTYDVVIFDTAAEVQYIFSEGAQVEALAAGCNHHTATCRVTDRNYEAIQEGMQVVGYKDVYKLEKLPGVKSVFSAGWYDRARIEK